MVVVKVEMDGRIWVLIVEPLAAAFWPFPFPFPFPFPLLLLFKALTKEVIDWPDEPRLTESAKPVVVVFQVILHAVDWSLQASSYLAECL